MKTRFLLLCLLLAALLDWVEEVKTELKPGEVKQISQFQINKINSRLK